MADASWDAYKGQGKFDGKPINVRALMVLYPNRMHIVTVEGTGINKMSDLKGKRVSTGAPNSATQIMAYRVLEAYGIDPEKDIIRERLDPGKSVDAIKDKKLDAFFWVGGIPTPAVTDLGATPGLKLKLIDHSRRGRGDGQEIRPAVRQGRDPGEDPTRGRTRRTRSRRCGTCWWRTPSMSDQLAYDIVKTMFERKEDMIRVHAEARNFDYKYQTQGAAVMPFHPGAMKYFAEKGVKLN